MPDTCPICNSYIGSGDNDEVAAPNISYGSKRGPDRLYRDMEQKSELRAQMAAERTGMSASEVSHLKMTDMRDNMRTGDTAQLGGLTPTQQAMANNSTFTPDMGVQLSRGTKTGPFPRAGTSFIENVLKPGHQADANAIRGAAARSNRGS